jgi:predicted permease
VVRYFDESLRRIRALPGVVSAGIVSRLPLSGSWNDAGFVVEGSPEIRAEEQPTALLQAATEGTFAALGVPVLQGRAFGETDRQGATCIVSAALSRKYLGGEALGRRLLVGSRRGPCTVVGVVGNVRHVDLEDERQMAIYRPEMQMPDREVAFAIRSSVPPETLARAVRAALLAVDRDQPVSDVVSLRRSVDDNALLGWRYAAGLAGSFALIALLLSGVGVYAVMAVSVAQRSRELGIRMALGARSPDVVRLVLGQGLKTAGLGIAIGLAVALASARILEGVVYGVAPRDPLTLAVTSLFLFAVAAFACSLPARRATRVDPVAVLRAE